LVLHRLDVDALRVPFSRYGNYHLDDVVEALFAAPDVQHVPTAGILIEAYDGNS
jgi:hypothetical protein